MSHSRPKLRRAIQNALAETHRARTRHPGAGEQLQQLVVSLEQALVDVDNDREAQVLGYGKWVAEWLPDAGDPLLAALETLESAAIAG